MSGYLPVAKLAAQFVAGLGVSKILSGIIQNNVTIVTTADKVLVTAGNIVLGSMLVEQTSNHIERTTNEIVTWFEGKKTENDTK